MRAVILRSLKLLENVVGRLSSWIEPVVDRNGSNIYVVPDDLPWAGSYHEGVVDVDAMKGLQSLPSTSSFPFVSNYAGDILDVPPVKISIASIRGLSHMAEGKPRQDSYAVESVELGDSKWIIVAMCDGLSSSEFSEIASSSLAQIACQSVGVAIKRRAILPTDANELMRLSFGNEINERFNKWRDSQRRSLQREGKETSEAFLTTLQIVVIEIVSDFANVTFMQPAGDGTLITGCQEESASSLNDMKWTVHVSPSGSSAVRPFGSGEVDMKEITIKLDPGQVLIASTDGMDVLASGSDMAEKLLREVKKPHMGIADTARWISFLGRSTTDYDDRTSLLVWNNLLEAEGRE